jgi:stage III sporulation protein AF
MMTAVREWLVAVVAASLLISLSQSLIPEGTIRRAAAMTGGLILLVTMLQPLVGLTGGRIRLDFGALTEEIDARQEELQQSSAEELKRIIEDKAQAYISDKARTLGLACTAQVTARMGEDGVPVPYEAVLYGTPSAQLSDAVQQELGIPKERQIWEKK